MHVGQQPWEHDQFHQQLGEFDLIATPLDSSRRISLVGDQRKGRNGLALNNVVGVHVVEPWWSACCLARTRIGVWHPDPHGYQLICILHRRLP
jgi:hypothetical protein